MVNHRLILDLVERVGALAQGGTVSVPLGGDGPKASAQTVAAWCQRSGNQLVEIRSGEATVRRGRTPDPAAQLAPDLVPGTRLWVYTNFDCNLACDYCCVRSSPRSARRPIGSDRLRRLASEAVSNGVRELVLTGGEPFLLPDIEDLVALCTSALPTTLLTNGMLFHGRRREALSRMDRHRLALQISLDSATPDEHDRHRGAGSWKRAVGGIKIAREEGFRVRVAATLPHEQTHQVGPFHGFLDSLGIARDDQVVRALAHRGVADHGIELTLETLIPEVTVTADGVYWHPVSADHEDQLVTRHIFPLQGALTEVNRRFADMRAKSAAAAQWFPCA